ARRRRAHARDRGRTRLRPPGLRTRAATHPDAEGVSRGARARPGDRGAGAVAMCLGIPGEVVDVRDDAGLRIGTVRFAGITRDVCLDYVPDAAVGEYVLVHVGFAISKINPEE